MSTTTIRAAVIAGALATIPMIGIATGEAEASSCPPTMNVAINGVGGNPAYVPGVPAGPRINVHYRNDLRSVVTDPIGTRRSGERALSSAISGFRARCPNSHVRVYGYSYGSWVAGNVRDTNREARRNSSWVLVSDPRSRMGVLRLVPSIPGYFEAQGVRGRAKAPTAKTCRTTDGVCWVPDPVRDPLGAVNSVAGYLSGAHGYRSSEVRQAPGVTVHRGSPVFVAPTGAPASVPATPRVEVQVVVDAYVPEPVKPIVPVEVANIPVPPVVSDVLDGLGLRVKP